MNSPVIDTGDLTEEGDEAAAINCWCIGSLHSGFLSCAELVRERLSRADDADGAKPGE